MCDGLLYRFDDRFLLGLLDGFWLSVGLLDGLLDGFDDGFLLGF